MKSGKTRSWSRLYLMGWLAFWLIGAVVIGFASETSLLFGFIGMLLSAPWGWVTAPLLDAVGYITWYDQFIDQPFLYGALALAGFLPAVALNAILIYLIERRTGRRSTTKA